MDLGLKGKKVIMNGGAHGLGLASLKLFAAEGADVAFFSRKDDKIEADDPFARALWEEHRRRMASKIGALETGIPRSSLPQRDPWGMRVALALLLFVAFGFSYSGNAGRPSADCVASSAIHPWLETTADCTSPVRGAARHRRNRRMKYY